MFPRYKTIPLVFAIMAVCAEISACGGGAAATVDQQSTGSASTPSSTKVASVATLTVPHYGQVSTFVISGSQLSKVAPPTANGCENVVVQAQTDTSLTISCVPVSLSTSFTVANQQTATLSIPVPQVTFLTSLGTVVVQMSPAQAPITVRNFLWYVNSGYYNKTIFHRVISGFVDQGGGFTSVDAVNNNLIAQTDPTQSAINLETNLGLSNIAGTIAMARTNNPNSATSEFFFNVVDNSSQLDYQSSANPGYAVFGSVVSGMEVVTAINGVTTRTVGVYDHVPVSNVTIQSVTQTQ